MAPRRLRRAATLVVAAGIVPLLSFAATSGRAPTPAPANGAAPANPAAPAIATQTAAAAAATDSARFDMAAAVAELRRSIAGRENAPSDSVWKNIKVMKQVPAGRLINIMEQGYSRGLGVNCLHCHVSGDWASDDKRPKQVTRDMMAMTGRINNELLTAVPNLQSEKPTVNCTTCHRGEVKPALSLAPPTPKPGG